MLLTRQATKKKKKVLRVGGEAQRVSDAAGRLLASEKAKVIREEKKNERRSRGSVEPEREEAPGRSSAAAGGSEDSKYHKSCSGAAADALWISRTPGNPNDGSHCTRRAAAEISISVWFAQIRTQGRGGGDCMKVPVQTLVTDACRNKATQICFDFHRLRPLADDEVIGLRPLVKRYPTSVCSFIRGTPLRRAIEPRARRV